MDGPAIGRAYWRGHGVSTVFATANADFLTLMDRRGESRLIRRDLVEWRTK